VSDEHTVIAPVQLAVLKLLLNWIEHACWWLLAAAKQARCSFTSVLLLSMERNLPPRSSSKQTA
jgi:hypothetical protein